MTSKTKQKKIIQLGNTNIFEYLKFYLNSLWMKILTITQYWSHRLRLNLINFAISFVLSTGHRRTASLPSGPLFSSRGSVPSTPVFKNTPPVFPSLSQFTRVLDETRNSFDADTTDHQSNFFTWVIDPKKKRKKKLAKDN